MRCGGVGVAGGEARDTKEEGGRRRDTGILIAHFNLLHVHVFASARESDVTCRMQKSTVDGFASLPAFLHHYIVHVITGTLGTRTESSLT